VGEGPPRQHLLLRLSRRGRRRVSRSGNLRMLACILEFVVLNPRAIAVAAHPEAWAHANHSVGGIFHVVIYALSGGSARN
jgi:hypothetical protein